LLRRLSIASAGAATGVIWTLWHLPIYFQPGTGLTAFASLPGGLSRWRS
jgi:hypothetical protein